MPPTLRSARFDEFLRDPHGAYVVGDSWLYFCAGPELVGSLLWGRPTTEDVERLVQLFRVELGPTFQSFVKLVDTSRLEVVDPGAFDALARWVGSGSEGRLGRLTRVALVHAEGLAGAVAAGFFAVTPPSYEARLFDARDEAWTWLCGEPMRALQDELEQLYTAASGVAPAVARLRAVLGANLDAPTLDSAARSLGVSSRTLQRRLGEAGTTFQAEVVAARLAAARRLMVDTDLPLTRIALDVGFSSVQHFSRAFRSATGEQPSAWRKRNLAP